ncbi:hypothetical protein T492DRAFT_914199 [Pavlovales sp. CCMP2436]|nr:hypothetical protein T492DRAFT_914199 [Pavlovales sp. CCMP2436]
MPRTKWSSELSQDDCMLTLWTIDHGRQFCPPAAYAARQTRPRLVSADGRSQLKWIGSPATSSARFSTQGVRAAGSMGAAVHSGTQQRAPATRASLMPAWRALQLDEHAPTPSHASLDAKLLAMFGLLCHKHIAEAR